MKIKFKQGVSMTPEQMQELALILAYEISPAYPPFEEALIYERKEVQSQGTYSYRVNKPHRLITITEVSWL